MSVSGCSLWFPSMSDLVGFLPIPPEAGRTMWSGLAELAFPNDALMAVAGVLDPVLQVARLARHLAHYGVDAAGRAAVEGGRGERHPLADREFVDRDCPVRRHLGHLRPG